MMNCVFRLDPYQDSDYDLFHAVPAAGNVKVNSEITLKMMNSVLKMMNSALKMMHSVLNMMKYA